MSFWSLFSKSSTSNISQSLQNLTTGAQQAAVVSNDPTAITVASIANAVLGNNTPILNSTDNQNLLAPIAPTQVQLEAAMKTVVNAQNVYNQLLAQQKAVAAYETVMKTVQTEQISITPVTQE